MSLFCLLTDLHNESDVEQKLVWPILTNPEPQGLGYSQTDVYTKHNIQYLTLEKGRAAQKVYRPDYIVLLAGFPLIVVEVKHPGDNDIDEALREARLYAAELNALHPAGVNPCTRIVACNGKRLVSSPADTTVIDHDIAFADLNLGSASYHDFRTALSRDIFQRLADEFRKQLKPVGFSRALHLLGGKAVRSEEIGYNEFGSQLSLDFLHVFDPRTRAERAAVVRDAYVPSRQREQYVGEIDRVVKMSATSPVGFGTKIRDTASPDEVLRVLGRGRELQNRLFLLVGSVGSGKSTFVDYLREVKLSSTVKETTHWISVDMNSAPVGRAVLEQWVVDEIIGKLKNSDLQAAEGGHDFLLKLFSVELQELRQGVLSKLSPGSPKYEEMVADELAKQLANKQNYAKALGRHLCSERAKLLVLVLDNCDKGNLEEQLNVFQIVRWVQSWLKCLVFLPIRDVTYLTYRDRPPLDTAIKEFVFRIEPPPFADVLRRRIQMALKQLLAAYAGERLGYNLESGIRVEYPATDLGLYLGCIYKSLYEHDHLLRRMLVGLAGKNMRKAMEIFLDFCKSGHINSGEFFKIRAAHGDYALPYKVVSRVLLRLNRRYYDGDQSHVKNLFQCDPADARPDHCARLAILRWLDVKSREKGPSGVKGFHRAATLIAELTPLGHDAARVRKELLYLVQALCVMAEHQRNDSLADEELVALSSAGFAHLSMVDNLDYLAACSEDTWVGDEDLAERVAERVGQHGRAGHFSRETARANASDLTGYLAAHASQTLANPHGYLTHVTADLREELTALNTHVVRVSEQERAKDVWHEVEGRFVVGNTYEGSVKRHSPHGLIILLDGGPSGLVHRSKLPKDADLAAYPLGSVVRVRVLNINQAERKMSLRLVTA